MRSERFSAGGLAVFLLVLASTTACDQISKHFARESLRGIEPLSLLAGRLQLIYVENLGAFLGLGQTLSPSWRFWIFTVGTAAVLAMMIWHFVFARRLRRLELVGLALLIGGGLGNLIDRLLREGAVTDFMMLSWGPWHTGIFNLADVAILLGMAFLFVGFSYPRVAEPNERQ